MLCFHAQTMFPLIKQVWETQDERCSLRPCQPEIHECLHVRLWNGPWINIYTLKLSIGQGPGGREHRLKSTKQQSSM